LKFAINHEAIGNALLKIGEARDAVPRITRWNNWLVSTSLIASGSRERKPIPEGFTVARVPEDQLDIVLCTSSIPRQPSTMLMLPSVGLLNEDGKLVAWGYVGIDGSFATLYVLPEYRGKGLASVVAVELLTRLDRGEFGDMGYEGKSGWVQSDVYVGNEGSEGVMKSLGGFVGWQSTYIWIDSEKF
jgi:GNAT superfamily N-acetyltransferase